MCRKATDIIWSDGADTEEPEVTLTVCLKEFLQAISSIVSLQFFQKYVLLMKGSSVGLPR
jgi:hypothetical protein